MDFRGIAMVVIAAASWGTWSLFLRPTGLPGLVTAPIVFLLMGLASMPLVWRTWTPAIWDRRTYAWLAAYVALDAINLVAFFAAIDTTTVQIAVLSHYLAPIIVALAAPYIDRTRVRGAWFAALIALGGLVIVLEPWRASAHGALPGALLGATSALAYAGNVFTLRRLSDRIGASRAMAYHSLIAAVVLAPLVVGSIGRIRAVDVALLAAGSATIGAISGIVFAIGLQRIGAARAAILAYVEPVVAVLVGAVAYDEPLHAIALVGGAMILGAGVMISRHAATRDDRDARVQ